MRVNVATDNPYSDLIARYVVQTFPRPLSDKRELVEALTTAVVATGTVRYGPAPSPEQLVEIRKVIRESIGREQPLPILVPWGGRKTSLHAGVDLAEIGALKTLEALDARVRAFYPPGTRINVRLEDTGAVWLFRDEPGNVASVRWYTDTFVKLVGALGLTFVNPIPESTLMPQQTYDELSAGWSEQLADYLSGPCIGSGEAFERLVRSGWKGVIPPEQRAYYYDRYRRLYPDATEPELVKRLADYLGGAAARYALRGSAAPAERFLTVSLVPPVPGAPDGLTSRRIYYRTLPTTAARTHIAPWRAKGYLKIHNDNSITPKLCAFGDVPEELHHCTITIDDVPVQADYVVEG